MTVGEGLRVRLSEALEARLLALQGARARLWTPVPWAIGQPVCIEVYLDDTSANTLTLQGRCAGARRIAPNRYEAVIRLVNLCRADRERLLQALAKEDRRSR